MEILHDEGSRGEFHIDRNGERLAVLDYVRTGDRMNITHTEVSDELSGQGVGKKLVAAAIDYARKNHLKVKATCPFAAKVIDRTPEFQDVLESSHS